MLANTSREAYKSIKDLGDKQRIVYEAIKMLGQVTNEQLSIYLGWPIQSVTGRVNELSKFNMVVASGTRKTKSGRMAKLWAIKAFDEDKTVEKAYTPKAVSWLYDEDSNV